MGNCCQAYYNDDDLLDSPKIQALEKCKNLFKEFSNDYQNQTRHNTGIDNNNKAITDSNQIIEKNFLKISQEKDIYISKTKLKIIVKQSKFLQEGKEYLINSLGLLDSNNNNKYFDGIVIFGDINVSKNQIFYFTFFRLIQEQILYFRKKKVVLSKIMQKFVMIKH
jgi:hypothetical protein